MSEKDWLSDFNSARDDIVDELDAMRMYADGMVVLGMGGGPALRVHLLTAELAVKDMCSAISKHINEEYDAMQASIGKTLGALTQCLPLKEYEHEQENV